MPDTSADTRSVPTSPLLPCGDEIHTISSGHAGQEQRVIALGPYPGASCRVWCPEHGWLKVTEEQLDEIAGSCDGIA